MGALAIVPILGCAGMAIDFTRAMELKAELQNAADAAVIGAISEKSAGVGQAINMAQDGPIPLSEAEAEALFKAQREAAGSSDDQQSEDENMKDKIKVSVVKKGKDIKAELSYTATMKTSLLRAIGKDTITVSGTATAVYQSQSFMDFYMLLDNTPSMGVAATPTDVTNMIAATANVKDSGSRNCAFASTSRGSAPRSTCILPAVGSRAPTPSSCFRAYRCANRVWPVSTRCVWSAFASSSPTKVT